MRLLRKLLPACALLLSLPAAAADWTEPAREFARRIAERSGFASAVALTLDNRALDAAQAAAAFRAVESELRARRVEVVEPARAIAAIRVTFAENVQGHLWTAEIRQGESRDVVMLGFDRGEPGVPAAERPLLILRRTPLFAHPEPILDAAPARVEGFPDALLVLHPGKAALYRAAGGRWEHQATVLLPSARPFPRDVRGRLLLHGSLTFDAYLPGLSCSGTMVGTLGANCQESDDPWPLTASGQVRAFFNPARNFFVRMNGGAESAAGPFFSAAVLDEGAVRRTVVAAVDGSLTVAAPGQSLPFAGASGSDVTAIRGGCGDQRIALLTGAGDGTAGDTIEARDVFSDSASAPLRFAGPITALWPADDRTATAVARNLRTGDYEAFHLSVACGQ